MTVVSFEQPVSNLSIATLMDYLRSLLNEAMSKHKDVLTFEETAGYLGISKSYLYKLTSSRAIPYSKPRGKLIYFDKREIDRWALRNRITTDEELEQAAIRQMYSENESRSDKVKPDKTGV